MKNYWIFGLILAFGMITSSLILMSGKSIDSDMEMMSSLPQVIKAVPIDASTNFAGETVPIHKFDVKERLDRELMVNSYWHSNTILNIKLAHRFFPIIEPILAKNGIPDDFKYLAVAESDLQIKTSYAGAKGYWQFMKTAGKEMGLEINDEVDERCHIEKSTQAACDYINQLKNRFGTWTEAAAAYNTGPTRLKRYKAEQKANTYYDMNLGSETNRYVFRILAFKYILSNPNQFGFYIEDHEKYQPLNDYYEETVEHSISSWASFAQNRGISYRTLKIYNPWLMDSKLTVVKNKYSVKIPIKR